MTTAIALLPTPAELLASSSATNKDAAPAAPVTVDESQVLLMTESPTHNAYHHHHNHHHHLSALTPAERSEHEYFERNTRMGCILFVGNLPFQTPWQHVKDRFQEAGKVRYTDLIADGEGRPKGSALVTMESPEGSQRAIELFNEQLFDGRRLIVRLLEAGRRPPLVQRECMPSYGRGTGAPATTQAAVPQVAPTAGFFQPNQFAFGGQGRGIGYKGRYNRGGYLHLGYQHTGEDVVPPKPRSQQLGQPDDEAGRKLYVGNLPYDCTNSALHDTFMQVGTVVRAELRIGRNGRSSGTGTVVMSTVEDARNAINEFDGIEMAGRAMKVNLDHSA